MIGVKIIRFKRYAWVVLAFNIFVILWGAYVRATGSGAGCGSHWPLCNGVLIPRSPVVVTIIELFHRMTSGVALILVIILWISAMRIFAPGSLIRRAATFSVVFIITEALLGASLVLFGWVADDASMARAISIVLHLVNTFILLAFLSITAWLASVGDKIALRQDLMLISILILGWIGTLLIGASGALAALGDTLFPVNSLAEGIRQDFSPTAHFLIRLRLLHPTISILVGSLLLILAGYLRVHTPSPTTTMLARFLTVGVVVQMAAGGINILLLAPVWMQLVHLLLADLVWIILVLTTVSVFQSVEQNVSVIQSDDRAPILGPGGI
jgi:heme A synthase